MRSIQVCPLHLDGNDFLGNSRLERNVRYVEWFRKYPLADELCFVDNGSSDESIHKFWGLIGGPDVFIRKMPLLYGNHFALDYPYCWRALHYITNLIHYNYDKVVLCDSDYFVLSKRLRDHVLSLDTGWESLWCIRHGFPEASFQVLCKDAFNRFLEFWGPENDWTRFNGKLMERELPFTKVNRDFRADRFGELRVSQQPWMDAYGQAPLDIPLKFEGA